MESHGLEANVLVDGLQVLVMESEEEIVEKVERLVEPSIERSSDADVGCWGFRVTASAVLLNGEKVEVGKRSEPETEVAIANVVVSSMLAYSSTSNFFCGGKMVSVVAVAECCESDS